LRIAYTSSGKPTAAIIANSKTVIDYTLFWISCETVEEIHYLLAIVNSNALYEKVTPLMPKGQFGARHLQKHLWKLPIPKFDYDNGDHIMVSRAGAAAEVAAKWQLDTILAEDEQASVTAIRKKLRSWLEISTEGKSVEEAVEKLLS